MKKMTLGIAMTTIGLAALLGGCSSQNASQPANPNSNVNIKSDGLGGISGWSPATQVCGDSSVNQFLIMNRTGKEQTLNVTVNQQLSTQVKFNTGVVNECGRPEIDWGQSYTQEVTVPAATYVPGQATFYLTSGGVDHSVDGSHNIGIGSGQSSWYDFGLNLNVDLSFKSLGLTYSGTGGIDPSQNDQPGLLNVMNCDTSDGLNITDWNELSTYSSQDTEPTRYGTNEPVCMAFLEPQDGSTNPNLQPLPASLNVPPSPTVQVDVIYPTLVSMQLPESNEPYPPVTSYTVTASPGGFTCTANAEEEQRSCTLPNLPKGTYEITATATNVNGTSAPGPSTQFVVN